MKIFEKFSQKFAKKASSAVKSEVQNTAIDLLPKILGVAVAIVGVVIFRDATHEEKPTLTATHITTNNYFLGNGGEEVIRKIMEREGF